MTVQLCCELLEAQLRAEKESNECIAIEMAALTIRVQELERELANEQEMRRALEEAVQDETFVATLERMVARHSVALENAQERSARALAEMKNDMKAATVRHEQAILSLVASHRREVTQRLDAVLNKNNELFAQFHTVLQNTWAERGTTRPSEDKEHWLIVAREDTEVDSGASVITFKIHSGQRDYIDRISRTKNVILACPAANGVDVRQTAKKRLREVFEGQDGFEIKALKFSCSRLDQADNLLAFVFESIEYALTPPVRLYIAEIYEEASQNLRLAFDVDELFTPADAA